MPTETTEVDHRKGEEIIIKIDDEILARRMT